MIKRCLNIFNLNHPLGLNLIMTESCRTIESMFYYYIRENNLNDVVQSLEKDELDKLLNYLDKNLYHFEIAIKIYARSYEHLIENIKRSIKDKLPDDRIADFYVDTFNKSYRDIIISNCSFGLSNIFKPSTSFDIIISDTTTMHNSLINIISNGSIKIHCGIIRRDMDITFETTIKVTCMAWKNLISEKLEELRKNKI